MNKGTFEPCLRFAEGNAFFYRIIKVILRFIDLKQKKNIMIGNMMIRNNRNFENLYLIIYTYNKHMSFIFNYCFYGFLGNILLKGFRIESYYCQNQT